MTFQATITGSGPNGLAAGVLLGRHGLRVVVLEQAAVPGGGSRTAELTLPGFRHDVCAAIHPVARISPWFRALEIEAAGVSWCESPAALAHPFDDGTAALLLRSMQATGETLDAMDRGSYIRAIGPFVRHGLEFFDDILRPIRFPRHPARMARFGMAALRSGAGYATSRFEGPRARALFAGCAAHSMVPLSRAASASFALALMVAAHAVGWPFPVGGSDAIIRALERRLREANGELRTGIRVESLDQLPSAKAHLFDLTPRQILSIAGERLPASYGRRLSRYRYGPGVFKIDWALDGPIPWTAGDCATAATVHLGGTMEEIVDAEERVGRGEHPGRPFVLLAQQSLFDRSRAPEGKQTGWAYCHVPAGSARDMTEAIEAQVERFAPGFRSRILARHTSSSVQLEAYNPNMIGGDIGGGANDLIQLLMRPVPRFDPYRIPGRDLYIASSSAPPGGGVHGMCGYWAARSALRNSFRIDPVI